MTVEPGVVYAKQYYAFFDAPENTELVMTIEEPIGGHEKDTHKGQSGAGEIQAALQSSADPSRFSGWVEVLPQSVIPSSPSGRRSKGGVFPNDKKRAVFPLRADLPALLPPRFPIVDPGRSQRMSKYPPLSESQLLINNKDIPQ